MTSPTFILKLYTDNFSRSEKSRKVESVNNDTKFLGRKKKIKKIFQFYEYKEKLISIIISGFGVFSIYKII